MLTCGAWDKRRYLSARFVNGVLCQVQQRWIHCETFVILVFEHG